MQEIITNVFFFLSKKLTKQFIQCNIFFYKRLLDEVILALTRLLMYQQP